jgi:hypothetical protein
VWGPEKRFDDPSVSPVSSQYMIVRLSVRKSPPSPARTLWAFQISGKSGAHPEALSWSRSRHDLKPVNGSRNPSSHLSSGCDDSLQAMRYRSIKPGRERETYERWTSFYASDSLITSVYYETSANAQWHWV